MIAFIIVVGFAFIWLGYETDWMRVRLPVYETMPRSQQAENKQKVEKAAGKWQFLKYGDDSIMMRGRCYLDHCNLCRQGDRFFTWRIPSRTVKIAGSIINFKSGCNLYRANLLKDIVKAQKTAKPRDPYPVSHYATQTCLPLPNGYIARQSVIMQYFKPSIEIKVDGKSITNINGDYKRGMTKDALKPYTTKIKVGRQSVTCSFGEADRVPP